MPPLMSSSRLNQVLVPIYELDEKGHVKPNPLFHRPIDKLHSRSIEYPFAASRVGNAERILDVGTVKASPVWISWLESLPIEVHATDYDEPFELFNTVQFHQSDIRNLQLPDGMFDKIFAVSVIEHIGLESPQVLVSKVPDVSNDGDLEAVRELARVLKPGGELIMTLPFGVKDGLVLGNQARNYTIDSIKKFGDILDLVHLEYYEYQRKSTSEVPLKNTSQVGFQTRIFEKVLSLLGVCLKGRKVTTYHDYDAIPIEVTWEEVPPELAKATQSVHTEGVACGVWKKHSINTVKDKEL